ncbi:MAG: DUF2306 domain-containing protein [Bacteroidota bacterium]
MSNKVAWFVFVFSAISVGSYPVVYWFTDRTMGLLQGETDGHMGNVLWSIGFHGNIIFGATALLVGWSQFSKKLAKTKASWYTGLGEAYIWTAFIGGACALCISFFAEGGFVASLGFAVLAILWLFTTIQAYLARKKKDMSLYRGMVLYSYAACYAAVTIRFWLPVTLATFGDFLTAYKIVAWLCWIPNIVFAYFWVKRKGLQID